MVRSPCRSETALKNGTRRAEFVLELSDEDAFIVHRVSYRAGQTVDYGFDD